MATKKRNNAIPATMRAMTLDNPGAPEAVLTPAQVKTPKTKSGEVLIKVACAGMNRAELFQLQKRYPLPEATPMIPGIEIAGVIVALGKGVKGRRIGERVCAITSEGGFAEYASVPAGLTFKLPKNVSFAQSVCLPEGLITLWISLVHQASVQKGETVLIHGGASGMGLIGIQMAKLLGAKVYATAGSDEKCRICTKIGAKRAINYKKADFVTELLAETRGKGVNVIVDMVGGDYFEKNLKLLSHKGRLAIIAFLRGAKIEANLSPILLKKLSIHGSVLRLRPLTEKAAFAASVTRDFWPFVTKGRLKCVIDSEIPLEKAMEGIIRLQENLNIGKIVLHIQPI